MNALREKLSHAGKFQWPLRALTAAAIFLAMHQVGSRSGLLVAIPALLAGCLLIYLCDFRVSSFGAAFGFFLEYYALHSEFTDARIRLAMLAVSCILYFISFRMRPAKTPASQAAS